MSQNAAIWIIAGLATLGVIVRPFRIPEYVSALAGAAALILTGLLPWRDGLAAAAKGTDVYLFLVGMMLLSEVARQEGLFDWLATHAVGFAKGSAKRLFFIVYCVGTAVTVLLSNDATAVVLTPAVYAAAKAADVEPLPYLFICAFIANAASFVLPVSNPANLVVFGEHMPLLLDWLRLFTLPSIAAVVITYLTLRFTQRHKLQGRLARGASEKPLSGGGTVTGVGILATACVLVAVSTLGRPLGLPTFLAGLAVTLVVLAVARRSPLPIVRDISWGILPLVAGLFILVEGVQRSGILDSMARLLGQASEMPRAASLSAGLIAGLASNLLNNLPTGLIAATLAQGAELPTKVTAGLLVGVDLGPNLSVTGSLATLLWLTALRREGETVTAWQFLKLGAVVMTPALLAALAVLALMPA